MMRLWNQLISAVVLEVTKRQSSSRQTPMQQPVPPRDVVGQQQHRAGRVERRHVVRAETDRGGEPTNGAGFLMGLR